MVLDGGQPTTNGSVSMIRTFLLKMYTFTKKCVGSAHYTQREQEQVGDYWGNTRVFLKKKVYLVLYLKQANQNV